MVELRRLMELLPGITPYLIVAHVTRGNIPLVIENLLEINHELLPFLMYHWCLLIDVGSLHTNFDINRMLICNTHPLSRVVVQGPLKLLVLQSNQDLELN